MAGHVTFWSGAMEQRYGFSADEAVGQVTHRLLRTASWQSIDEIEAMLAQQDAWSGGLIHHTADGRPTLVANYWHLHRDSDNRDPLVSELHADIVPPESEAADQFADIIDTIAQQISQPLTAAGGYVGGMQRLLQAGATEAPHLQDAMQTVNAQIARAGAILNRLRSMGSALRTSRIRLLHARLSATMEQTERIMRGAGEAVREVASTHATAAAVRGRRAKERLETAAEQEGLARRRTALLENIDLFNRLLLQGSRLDDQTRQAVNRLLQEESAKLAALNRR